MKFGERVLLKQYKNGNKLWGIVTPCGKCQHSGKVIWDYANHVCFDCNGKGWYYEEEREYTPENLAKREAQIAKKRAECEKEQAEREAARKAEQERREAERLAEIERNRGHFIGEVGDKIQVEVTLSKQFYFERPCFNAPWQMELVTVFVFKTDDGNTLVWKTTGSLGFEGDEGDRLTIKGTIKAHEEYRNVNQTILTRVKWVH